MVAIGQSGCIRKKWFYSGNVVVFGQNGCILAEVVVLGQSGCIMAKVVVMWLKLYY